MLSSLRPSGRHLGRTIAQSTTSVEMSELDRNDGVVSFIEITNGWRSYSTWLVLATKTVLFGLPILLGLAEKGNFYEYLFVFILCV